MWKLELEEEILKETLSEWESFLFSKEIYWQLNLSNKKFLSSERRVRISVGRLLISSFLLKNHNFLDSESILIQFIALKNKWLANWQKKASEELPVRIRQWNRTVSDLRVDAGFSQPQMNNQLQIRLMIGLLLDEIDEIEREQNLQQLAVLDQKLKHATIENGFIWEIELLEFFPQEKYWYLYRRIKLPGEKK
ncbi:MAG: hypothetical protein IH585_18095 [Anaerolineaceae bacterium]|nr:hypothetical protein [Anaerolineaceae bacterium]